MCVVVGVQRVLRPIFQIFNSFFWLCTDHTNDLVCGQLTATLNTHVFLVGTQVRMGRHRRLRLYSRKNYERKKRQKRSFLIPSAIVRANTSYNLGTTFCQVGTASLTFTPRYICVACQFEFGVGIVFKNTYADWKCELREGVLNIIKHGYKGTVTASQSTDSAILFPTTTLMEPVNWCENVPFPISSV